MSLKLVAEQLLGSAEQVSELAELLVAGATIVVCRAGK